MMNKPAPPSSSSSLSETMAVVHDLIEAFRQRVARGDSLSPEEFAAQHPQHEEVLRRLLPASQLLAHLTGTDGDAPMSAVKTEMLKKTLGDYRILSEIGRGGMGVVYEAEQVSMARRVALKVLPFAAVLDKRQLQRFKIEAQAAGALDHPNIVHVYSVGCERGVHYYAMQFVAGRSLAELISSLRQQTPDASNEYASKVSDDFQAEKAQAAAEEEPKPPDSRETDASRSRTDGESISETRQLAMLTTYRQSDRKRFNHCVARIGIQAAEALDYAHRMGVVHRDIKPSNLMLDDDGQVWLTDFGLALTRGDANVTMTGDVVGTLRYMSPEQASGQRGVVDHRTDIYSLGATLYELLTLRPALDGDDRHQLLRQLDEAQTLTPRKIDPQIPRDLETIVLRSLAKPADARYATAREMADDLRRFCQSRPVLARRTSRTELVTRWIGRNPAVASLIAASACLLLIASVSSGGLALYMSRVAIRESQARQDTAVRLYASDMRRAQAALQQGDLTGCEGLLMRHVPDKDKTDHRSFEWSYLWNQCHKLPAIRVLKHGLSVYDVEYATGGGLLATGTWNGRIHLWERASGKPLGILQSDQHHQGPVVKLAFVDDDESIVSASEFGTVCKWDVSSQTEHSSIDTDEKFALHEADIAPSRGLIAVAHGRGLHGYSEDRTGSASVWDVNKHDEPLFHLTDLLGRPCVAFSPQENSLVVSEGNGRFRALETSRWTKYAEVQAHDAPIGCLAFSPDGRCLASGSGVRHRRFVSGVVKLWDTSDWSELAPPFRFHSDFVRCVAFSRDGRYLAAGSYDRQVSLWDVNSHTLIRSFVAHSQPVLSVAFSPDGAELSSTSLDNTCRIWSMADLLNKEAQPSTLRDMDGHKVCVALSDDGRTIFYGSRFGSIEVRDARDGQLRYRLEHEGTGLSDVAISPNGDQLAVAWGTWPPDYDIPADVRLYHLASGEEICRMPPEHPFVRGLCYSPDGRTLAAGCAKHLVVWDTKTQRPLSSVGPLDHWIKSVRFRPDGKLIACTTDAGSTYFHSAGHPTLVKKLATDNGPTMSIDFSPGGKFFATGGSDEQVKIWDADSFEWVRSFPKMRDWVMHLRYSPDGRRILSGGKDGFVHLWVPETGESVLELEVDRGTWIMSGAFSANGDVIAAGGKHISLWRRGDRWKELRRLSVEELPPYCLQ